MTHEQIIERILADLQKSARDAEKLVARMDAAKVRFLNEDDRRTEKALRAIVAATPLLPTPKEYARAVAEARRHVGGVGVSAIWNGWSEWLYAVERGVMLLDESWYENRAANPWRIKEIQTGQWDNEGKTLLDLELSALGHLPKLKDVWSVEVLRRRVAEWEKEAGKLPLRRSSKA